MLGRFLLFFRSPHQLFGCGSVAQTVLSRNTLGEPLTVHIGFSVGLMMAAYVAGGVSGKQTGGSHATPSSMLPNTPTSARTPRSAPRARARARALPLCAPTIDLRLPEQLLWGRTSPWALDVLRSPLIRGSCVTSHHRTSALGRLDSGRWCVSGGGFLCLKG